MSIGIVVAHPDDECFGMGGTLARLAEENDLALLVLADGVTSRQGATDNQRRARDQEAEKAAEVLGIKHLHFLGLPDQRLDTLPLLEIVQYIEAWLGRVEPDTLYTHFAGDLNLDHRLTCQAVLTATRPIPGQTVCELYSFEVPSSTEWAFGQCGQSFQPNVFVDISNSIDTKLNALAYYETEMRAYPHPRSPEAIRARAQYWGQIVGCNYAEAFQLIRSVR